jgi:hypothetical protein
MSSMGMFRLSFRDGILVLKLLKTFSLNYEVRVIGVPAVREKTPKNSAQLMLKFDFMISCR